MVSIAIIASIWVKSLHQQNNCDNGNKGVIEEITVFTTKFSIEKLIELNKKVLLNRIGASKAL